MRASIRIISMKFTFNWLKEFVGVGIPAAELAKRLTMAGLEVESLSSLREPESNEGDWLFEVAVTPNRGDCLGINGLAREVAALTGGTLNLEPRTSNLERATSNVELRTSNVGRQVSVSIHAPELCARYSALVLQGLRVEPSPPLLRFRLEACGIRPVNNIVDVTNYVMLETGQPLHAFDLERLVKRNIVVRTADSTRKFTTLDGVARELARDDLLICDGDTPIAIAGIMGGMDSEVTAETRSILLESANFEPLAIRRTSKRLGLHSEASHRFERGVDPGGTVTALNRAAYLLKHVAGAEPVDRAIDSYPRPAPVRTLALRHQRVESLLGVTVAVNTVTKLLGSLGLEVTGQSGDVIEVRVPTSRPDLTREADLIEEIARLYGYEKIRSTLPLVRCSGGRPDYRLAQERRLRAFLVGEGLTEVINLPFATERANRRFGGVWKEATKPVLVLNPLAQESAEMRLSLIPGLIDNLAYNLAQRAKSFYAYQLSKVFSLGRSGEGEERFCLAGILYGSRPQKGLRAANEKLPAFLHCKGLVEGILDVLRLNDRVRWTAEVATFLHPGRAAALFCNGTSVGYLGQVHPDIQEELELPPFHLLELDFEELLEYAPRQIKAHFLPRFPSVERDFAIIVDDRFRSEEIVNWIENLGEAVIERVDVFDHYTGSPIPQGKKSLAYKISYRADDRTLTDAEVNPLHQRLMNQIEKLFGAQRRS